MFEHGNLFHSRLKNFTVYANVDRQVDNSFASKAKANYYSQISTVEQIYFTSTVTVHRCSKYCKWVGLSVIFEL